MANKTFNIDVQKLGRKSLKDVERFLQKEARAAMAKVSPGRIYIINGKIHVASRPGDAPNNLTGNLSRSIRGKQLGRNRLEFGSGNSRIKYAKILETILNRPNISTIVGENERKIQRIIDASVTSGLRK